MIKLTRHSKDPIIKPRQNIWWESKAVFNPGVAVYDNKIQMIYRAVGSDGISRFGYCNSADGINFSDFKYIPVFESNERDYLERLGCEDPRITEINGIFYIVYTGASLYRANEPEKLYYLSRAPWRTRVSLLATKDFKKFDKVGVILKNIDDKDGALFPDKFNNQYMLLHRVWPNICLSYSKNIKSFSKGIVIIKPRKEYWDNYSIGAGAQPLKTPLGWLLFYHGMDNKKVYRLGIIVLDINNPEKILYRSSKPIFEPECDFEKNGVVSNVVFTSGVVEYNNKYMVYYGGADQSIGLAYIEKDKLLTEIEREMN
jgi:predicted GH43/DUF377 family glycosyl hydrolase